MQLEQTHIMMVHLTEDLDFPEGANGCQKRLGDARDLLQSSAGTSARVDHRPEEQTK